MGRRFRTLRPLSTTTSPKKQTVEAFPRQSWKDYSHCSIDAPLPKPHESVQRRTVLGTLSEVELEDNFPEQEDEEKALECKDLGQEDDKVVPFDDILNDSEIANEYILVDLQLLLEINAFQSCNVPTFRKTS